jgi:hypothetical protein
MTDNQEVIHIPNVKFRAKLFLYKVVKLVQNGYARDLYQLAAWIVAFVTFMLLSENPANHSVNLSRQPIFEKLLLVLTFIPPTAAHERRR